MKLNAVFTFLLFFSMSWANAEPSKERVIDLGDAEVEGELRRPSINWIDSQKNARERLVDVFSSEYDEFQAKLLKPAASEKTNQPKQTTNLNASALPAKLKSNRSITKHPTYKKDINRDSK